MMHGVNRPDGEDEATGPPEAAYLVPVTGDSRRSATVAATLAVAITVVGLVAFGSYALIVPLVAVLLGGVAAWYFYQCTSTEGIGIEVTGRTVRLGRWPNRVVSLDLDQIRSAEVSTSPWYGMAPDDERNFVLRDDHYLTVTRTDGTHYRVAFDKDPETGHVRHAAEKVLRRLSAALPPPSANPVTATEGTTGARVGLDIDSPAADAGAAGVGIDRLWASAMARHDEVLAAYAPYEMDPVTALTYPAISDVSVPQTADFFEALADATALRPDDPDQAGAILEQYRGAVHRLTQAWRLAERRARQVGTGLLADDDARRVRQAAKLLGHAERAATAAERASYLRSARELIERLIARGAITAPPRVIEQIENSTALAIEAARSSAET